jgi:coenzyme F420-reducing hydrogenase gamma subunit
MRTCRATWAHAGRHAHMQGDMRTCRGAGATCAAACAAAGAACRAACAARAALKIGRLVAKY